MNKILKIINDVSHKKKSPFAHCCQNAYVSRDLFDWKICRTQIFIFEDLKPTYIFIFYFKLYIDSLIL